MRRRSELSDEHEVGAARGCCLRPTDVCRAHALSLAAVIVIVVVCYMKKRGKRTPSKPKPVMQEMAMQAGMPSAAPVMQEMVQPQIPAAQPKGRYDAYTGEENPMFDPVTGVQNWGPPRAAGRPNVAVAVA